MLIVGADAVGAECRGMSATDDCRHKIQHDQGAAVENCRRGNHSAGLRHLQVQLAAPPVILLVVVVVVIALVVVIVVISGVPRILEWGGSRRHRRRGGRAPSPENFLYFSLKKTIF